MNDDYVYTPASTDITIRWRAVYGWVPPSEQAVYQKKWSNFRALSAKGAEALAPAPQLLPSNLVKWKIK
jgi:hypothetical protein